MTIFVSGFFYELDYGDDHATKMYAGVSSPTNDSDELGAHHDHDR